MWQQNEKFAVALVSFCLRVVFVFVVRACVIVPVVSQVLLHW
jgi:hypothetical protein